MRSRHSRRIVPIRRSTKDAKRHVRHRLDGCHVEDSQIRLPLVESVQRIMIRAEVGRRRLPTNRSIEHLAQRDAIHNAAVDAKAVVFHDSADVCQTCR